MIRLGALFLMLTCDFGFSTQACLECMCCMNGERACSANKECIDGCIAGYYGAKCTDKCLENCKTCESGYRCTDCKPGYFGNKCYFKCGKGCINNTCSILLGKCSCKSVNFEEGYCTTCSGNKYGDECNNTCNCLDCSAETDCLKCKEELYYGTYCQHRCSHGCNTGKCHKHNGHCLSQECKPRYTGEKCDACLHGYYGKNCSLHCRKNCSFCISESNCTECKPGFYGESCMVSCPSGCKGNCSLNNGRCLECKLGFYGDFCDSTLINDRYGCNCSARPEKEGFTIGTLVGATLGAGLTGIVVGGTVVLALVIWRIRRNKQSDGRNENIAGRNENFANANANHCAAPLTYECLQSRDERVYSQITSSRQTSEAHAGDYDNCA